MDTLGYRRVSKREQAREGKTSLADQTTAITALAPLLGRMLLPGDIFEDQSSAEDVDGRPGFRALIDFCRAHPRPRRSPGHVLFLNDSRFGRFPNPDENAYWRFELSQVGWIVRFAENDGSEDKTARNVMRAIGGTQATAYRDNLIANARRGARGAAAEGLWQNEAPVGYRRLATASGRPPLVLEIGQRKSDDQQVRLTQGPPAEQRAVVEAFERYADGTISLGQLECPVRPESEWVVTLNAHPALVSQELYDAVQARLASNRRERRSTTGGYPLTGLIRCAQCGEAYVGGGGPKNHRAPSDPDRYRFYRDRGGSPGAQICPGRLGTLQKRIVEPAVIGAVATAVSDPCVQAMIHEEIAQYLTGARGDHRVERAELEKEVACLGRERDNLVGPITRGKLTGADADSQMKRIP